MGPQHRYDLTKEVKTLRQATQKGICRWAWNRYFARLALFIEFQAHPHLYPCGGQKPRPVGKKCD